MKVKNLLVAAALMVAMNVNAQDDYRNEISIAYGTGSNTDIVSSIGKGMFTGKQLNYWGPVSAEFFHYTGEGKLAFGGIVAVGGCKWDEDSNAKSTYFTAMPAIKYKWLDKSNFAMYSKAGFGVTLKSDSGEKKDESEVTVNWQATFVGMEYGGAFRGFVELGTGEQGILLAGLRYRF